MDVLSPGRGVAEERPLFGMRLAAHRFDDELRAFIRLERLLERLDDRERVLPIEHAVVVETEEEEEAVRWKSELGAWDRRDRFLLDADRKHLHRNARDPAYRVRRMLARHPDLVDVTGGRRHALRDPLDLPVPH